MTFDKRAYQQAWVRKRRHLRKQGLLPPPRKLCQPAVLDPDDYAHPLSDVRTGP